MPLPWLSRLAIFQSCPSRTLLRLVMVPTKRRRADAAGACVPWGGGGGSASRPRGAAAAPARTRGPLRRCASGPRCRRRADVAHTGRVPLVEFTAAVLRGRTSKGLRSLVALRVGPPAARRATVRRGGTPCRRMPTQPRRTRPMSRTMRLTRGPELCVGGDGTQPGSSAEVVQNGLRRR